MGLERGRRPGTKVSIASSTAQPRMGPARGSDVISEA